MPKTLTEHLFCAIGFVVGTVMTWIHRRTHHLLDKHTRFSLWLLIAVVVAAFVSLQQAQAAANSEALYSWFKAEGQVHWYRTLCGEVLWPALAVMTVLCWRFAIVACASLVGLGVLAFSDGGHSAWFWWALAIPLAVWGHAAAESRNPLDLFMPFSQWRQARRLARQAKAAPPTAQARDEAVYARAEERQPSTGLQPTPPAEDSPAAPAFPAEKPRRSLEDVSGMGELKRQLTQAAQRMRENNAEYNGILLWGEPGNGKTLFAEALAGHQDLPWISISVSNIVSKWVGQGPLTLSAAFQSARAQAPCVLFIDEADSVMAPRDPMVCIQDQINLTNTFLTESVSLRGSGVQLIVATNSLERVDAAAAREGRFDFKFEVPPPDYEARLALLTSGLKRHVRGHSASPELLRSLARRWEGFSVARLLGVAKKMPSVLAEQGKRKGQPICYEDALASLRLVQGRANRVPESAKSLADMVLSAVQREQLEGLAHRMRHVFDTEALGGSLPRGVLLWGPPGTGKTEAARALAKSTGWAFLTTSGNDLIHNNQAMDTLWRQALDARPAIVFIDEADDVLANRAYSPVASCTNKLLTLMDGVGGAVPDLLFLAATNHPGHMDGAALRGGRFSEKIEFRHPEPEALQDFVHSWLKSKGWALAPACDVSVLFGHSIANVVAILQAAVNAAITRAPERGRGARRLITPAALQIALKTTHSSF
jgi:transitional endoplasmic reticulum ATPase